MVYYVFELQTNNNTGSALVNTYTNRADAEEKYHEILKYASKSQVQKHGAMIVTEDLFAINGELGYREPVED